MRDAAQYQYNAPHIQITISCILPRAHLCSMTLLLAILEEVPLDVIGTNVWHPLPPVARRHLRCTCQRSRTMCDEFLTAATFTLDDSCFQHGMLDLTVEHIATFLERLPRLDSLVVNDWHGQVEFMDVLMHIDDDTRSCVTSLVLCCPSFYSGYTRSIQQFFSCLRSLALCGEPWLETDIDKVKCAGNHRALEDDVLLPLRHSWLTEVGASVADGVP